MGVFAPSTEIPGDNRLLGDKLLQNEAVQAAVTHTHTRDAVPNEGSGVRVLMLFPSQGIPGQAAVGDGQAENCPSSCHTLGSPGSGPIMKGQVVGGGNCPGAGLAC